ncbi:hypothetical protein ACNBFH_004440 [Salmonella enterica subsp. enterica serovar Bareilly]
MHKDHVFKKEPRTISRKQLEKSCGLEVIRSLELGLRPNPRSKIKAPIAARNLATGEVTIYYSISDLAVAGFTPSLVTHVINGNRETHKGHTFYRVAPDVWNIDGFDKDE